MVVKQQLWKETNRSCSGLNVFYLQFMFHLNVLFYIFLFALLNQTYVRTLKDHDLKHGLHFSIKIPVCLIQLNPVS